MARVDIDLDVFDYQDLIDELKDRITNDWNKREKDSILFEIAKLNGNILFGQGKMTLLNSMKLEFFLKNIDKISQEQLENLIN